MGKAGRFACIFLPMALTIASLICLVLVFLGQTNKSMSTLDNLYFFKANLEDFRQNDTFTNVPDIPGTDKDQELLEALRAVRDTDLKDFYQIGLWNYCEGDVDENNDNKEKTTKCSERKSHFWFNPVTVWGLENQGANDLFGDDLKDGLEIYRKVSNWMFTAYVIALVLTVAEFVVGFFAIFSRWGSLVTTIVSSAQTFFMIAAAITSTAVSSILVGAFNTVLKPFHINAHMGTNMLTAVWLGVAFSIASGFFWTISVCCCSGKSPHSHKKTVAEKTPYTYERVASPYLGAREGDHQMHNMHNSSTTYNGGQQHLQTGGGFEPYRSRV